MYISYQEMKEIIQFLEKHNIPFTFGNHYGANDLISGHWCEGSFELYTDELDDEDREWNTTP